MLDVFSLCCCVLGRYIAAPVFFVLLLWMVFLILNYGGEMTLCFFRYKQMCREIVIIDLV